MRSPLRRQQSRGARKMMRSSSFHRGTHALAEDEDIVEQEIANTKDAGLEKEWQEETYLQSVRMGASLLLVSGTFMFVRHSFIFMPKILDERRHSDWSHTVALVVESVFAFLNCFVSISCIRRPRVRWYFPMLGAWSFYVLMHGWWPFAMSCNQLIAEFLKQRDEEHPDGNIVMMTRNVDCTMQGHTIVQQAMTWLLMTPWLIPRSNLMRVNWLFIFVQYLGATLLYKHSPEHSGDEWFYDRQDIMVVLLLLCAVNGIALSKKFYLHKSQQTKIRYDLKQRKATEQIFEILVDMVPTHVIGRMLKNPGDVVADYINRVSILFIMITDFDQRARELAPAELLKFLNKQFTQMDNICERHGVTKIETVGEEYVAAVGVVPKDEEIDRGPEGHSGILGALVKVAAAILKLSSEDVQFKMGIHTGPVVAGVIGQKLPRFRLFGDTVNTSARLMQKGMPGHVQFGEETKRELPAWVKYRHRGHIELKGKGQVSAYLFDSRPQERGGSGATAGELPAMELEEAPVLPDRPQRASMLTRLSVLAQTAQQGRGLDAALPLLGEDEEARTKLGRSEVHAGADVLGDDEDDSEIEEEDPSKKRKKVEDLHRKFEQILSELKDSRETFASSNLRSARWWSSFGLQPADFSPEMEQGWREWYHKNQVCKKLDERLDKQCLALLVLTTLELVFCTFFGRALYHDELHIHGVRTPRPDSLGWVRLPLFLLNRGAAYSVLLGWRRIAQKGLVENRAQLVQWLLLVSYSLIVLFMFLSYDCLTLVDSKVAVRNSPFEVKDKLKNHKRGSSFFSLIFVPVYHLVTTQPQLPFKQSIAFAFVALGLMKVATTAHCNLFFSNNGKVMFIVTTVLCNVTLAWSAERNSKLRYKAARSIQLTQDRIQLILNTLMPPMVVEEIRDQAYHEEPPSHRYRCATIAQSDLVGFTQLASTQQPTEVVQFIGELFGMFDDLTTDFDIYKVETVGDAYIAGQADLPLTKEHQPLNVIMFGLKMVEATEAWSKKRGWSVTCRVGVAHGSCIGGIVGTEMQRYHLFGQLLAHLEVLEATAPYGKVQVSANCKVAVESLMIKEDLAIQLGFEPKEGNCLTTSKGEVHDFEAAGGAPFIVRCDLKDVKRIVTKGRIVAKD